MRSSRRLFNNVDRHQSSFYVLILGRTLNPELSMDMDPEEEHSALTTQ